MGVRFACPANYRDLIGQVRAGLLVNGAIQACQTRSAAEDSSHPLLRPARPSSILSGLQSFRISSSLCRFLLPYYDLSHLLG